MNEPRSGRDVDRDRPGSPGMSYPRVSVLTRGWGAGLVGGWQRFATEWAIAALKRVATAFRESRLRSRRDIPGVIRSQGVAFAVGRRLRTAFTFGVSVAQSDGVSRRPEKTGVVPVSNAGRASQRDASSSHYQRD